jgi:hypothetical protein
VIRLMIWLWVSVKPNWFDALQFGRGKRKARREKLAQISFIFGLIGRFYAIRHALDHDLRLPDELKVPREVMDAIMRAMYIADGSPRDGQARRE